MSIPLHPRYRQYVAARGEISQKIGEAARAYDLTLVEVICILTDEAHSWAGSALRAEREGGEVKA